MIQKVVASSEPPQTPSPVRGANLAGRPSWSIVALRLLLLLLATGAGVVALWIARHDEGDVHAARGRYVCPMHLEVTADAPDECPICRMALEPRTVLPRGASSAAHPEPGAADDPNSTRPTATQARQLANYARFSHIGMVRKHMLDEEIVAPAWLESDRAVVALIYRNEAEVLEAEERASFSVAGSPGTGFEVRLTADPPVSWDRSTSHVRFRLETNASSLRPGASGWIRLAKKPRQMLVVPSSAVLESDEGPYVLTYSVADRKFAKRPVEIGKVFASFAAVVSGVRERETVVEMNTFFVDAERRLREQSELGTEAIP